MDGFGFFGGQDVWWSSPSDLWSDAWGDQVINDLGITIWRTEYYPPADNLNGQDADWNKQLPVIRGLRDKAAAAGVDLKFIYTIWTPPSSMKCLIQNNVRVSGTPHPEGTKNGGALDPAKYLTFANYLNQGIQVFKDQNIDLYAISPQNEPFFRQFFNSCKYFPEWYTQMLKGVIPTVKASFPNVKIFGSEAMLETEGDQWESDSDFHREILGDAAAADRLDILAVHGYSDGVSPTSGSVLGSLWTRHRTLFAEALNKPQWMTETSGYVDSWFAAVEDGQEYPGAFSLAMDMMSGLNNGNMSGWVFWQGSENPGSSNIGRFVLMNGLVKGKKYHVSKQFYRYIRPGAVRVGATSTNNNVFVSAYQHAANGTHTIVLINNSGSAQNITVGGAGLPASFTIFRTSSSENCANVGTYSTGASLSLPANSVVTLQAGGTPLGSGGAGARVAVATPVIAPETSHEDVSTLVYPNPVRNENVTVDFSKMQRGDGPVEVKLLDMAGRGLRAYSTKESKLEIRRDELPAKGIYMLRINTGVKIEKVKLLVE
jgi:glucuronoarabinoxylan endo-1,4-beta-xylanase